MATKFFVFGTLRKFGGAGRAITNLGGTFTETAILDGYEMWVQGWIPYIIPVQNPGHTGIIIGDLVEVPDNRLSRAMYQLDTFEGYQKGHDEWCRYLRRKVKVQTENTGLTEAWCYVSNENLVRPYQDYDWVKVDSGDYVKFITAEQPF